MFKKVLTIMLSVLLFEMVCVQSAAASTKAEKQARLTEKVKANVSKLGVGQEARIEVKLQDQSRLTGYVSEIKDDSFTITNKTTGVATPVAYSNVAGVKGHNLSTGAKIGIGVAVGLLAMIAIWYALGSPR